MGRPLLPSGFYPEISQESAAEYSFFKENFRHKK
jgi:hypothetical protein